MFEGFFEMKELQNRKQLKANSKTFFLYLSNGDKTLFPLQYRLNQDKNKCNNNWNIMHSVIEIV